MGVWPASYVISGEASSLRLRARSQGIAWAFGGLANFAFSTVTPYIYNADAGNLRSKIGFVWMALCILTFTGVWYFIPEMLGRSPLELDLLFERGVPVRRFREWKPDAVELLVVGAKVDRD
jgi:hypothetical protein